MPDNRSRHTATFRLSCFLHSKESFNLSWVTGNVVSILYYLHSVMDMNYVQVGKEIFNLSNRRTALYSRTSDSTVRRVLALLVKHNLLTILHNERRKVTVYGIGKLFESTSTMNVDSAAEKPNYVHHERSLRSPRTQHYVHHELPLIALSKSLSKTERAQPKSAVPLSDCFFNKPEHERLAKELGLTQDDCRHELTKFKLRHNERRMGEDKWVTLYSNWLSMASDYKRNRITPAPPQTQNPYGGIRDFTQERIEREEQQAKEAANGHTATDGTTVTTRH